MEKLPIHLNIRSIIVLILGIVVLAAVAFGINYYLEPTSIPTSIPKDVFVSDITENQVTISWVTDKATQSSVVISEEGNFPFFPWQNFYYPDQAKKVLRTDRTVNHLVTIPQLSPDKSYSYRVYQGLRSVYQGKFTTGSILSNLGQPNPVYGRVLLKDKKTPAVGTLVYLFVNKEGTRSATLATLTDKKGYWTVDLGNMRTQDFKSSFAFDNKVVELVVIKSGPRSKFKAETLFGRDKPWPDIILNVAKQAEVEVKGAWAASPSAQVERVSNKR